MNFWVANQPMLLESHGPSREGMNILRDFSARRNKTRWELLKSLQLKGEELIYSGRVWVIQQIKKDVPSAVGSRTVWGLGEVISGRSFPHTVQCVEATARTCDLSVHRRQALPLAPGRPFLYEI